MCVCVYIYIQIEVLCIYMCVYIFICVCVCVCVYFWQEYNKSDVLLDHHPVQAYLILLNFCFSAICGYHVFFYKLKVCGNPALSTSIGTTFPTAFADFYWSVSQYFKLLNVLLFCGDLWSENFDVSTMTYGRLKC